MTQEERTQIMLKIAYNAGRESALREYEKEAAGSGNYQAPMRGPSQQSASYINRQAAVPKGPLNFKQPGPKVQMAGRMTSQGGPAGKIAPKR